MNVRLLLFVSTTLLAVTVAGVAAWQTHETARLRAEVGRLATARTELTDLRTAHEHLTATQVSDAESAALREAAAEAHRFRTEASAIRTAQTERTQLVPKRLKPSASPWTNAGRQTPAATVETAVWSSTQGEIETLAALLAFDPDTRAQIEAVFAGLPGELRDAYRSPEEVFATLVAARMPVDLKQVEVVEATSGNGGATTRIRLLHTDGRSRESTFRLQPDAGGWRLVVPARVADDCLRMITGGNENAGTR